MYNLNSIGVMTSKQVPRRKTVRVDVKLALQAGLSFARNYAEKNAKKNAVQTRVHDISRSQAHSQADLFYVLLQRLLNKGVISVSLKHT